MDELDVYERFKCFILYTRGGWSHELIARGLGCSEAAVKEYLEWRVVG